MACKTLASNRQLRHKSGACGRGGTGRRKGLKIPREEIPVPVRVRPSAPFERLRVYVQRKASVDFSSEECQAAKPRGRVRFEVNMQKLITTEKIWLKDHP